jgi:hypothetical protein
MRAASVLLALGFLALGLTAVPHRAAANDPALRVVGGDPIARGRYLVNYGGCNDCHTTGWDAHPGAIPEARRLTGSRDPFRGPWGTAYPTNLRLFIAHTTEARWLAMTAAQHAVPPPMPWFNVVSLSASDRRAIYAYVRSLGPAGVPMPVGVTVSR